MSLEELCCLCAKYEGVVSLTYGDICLRCASTEDEESFLLAQGNCGAAFEMGRVEAYLEDLGTRTERLRAKVEALRCD